MQQAETIASIYTCAHYACDAKIPVGGWVSLSELLSSLPVSLKNSSTRRSNQKWVEGNDCTHCNNATSIFLSRKMHVRLQHKCVVAAYLWFRYKSEFWTLKLQRKHPRIHQVQTLCPHWSLHHTNLKCLGQQTTFMLWHSEGRVTLWL